MSDYLLTMYVFHLGFQSIIITYQSACLTLLLKDGIPCHADHALALVVGAARLLLNDVKAQSGWLHALVNTLQLNNIRIRMLSIMLPGQTL